MPFAAPATLMPGGKVPGTKRREGLAPLRLAVEMGGEMQGRIPAARHGDEVALEALGLAGRVSDLDAPDALSAPHALNDGT